MVPTQVTVASAAPAGVPWFRVPGQSAVTRGVARVLVDFDGDFTWQRNSGDQMSVYMETLAIAEVQHGDHPGPVAHGSQV